MPKLVSIKPSTKSDKKMMAVFDNDGRTKTIHFGASGMDDYTKTKDKEQRARYRTRHAKDLTTSASKTGMSAGALSYYVLWGNSTSKRENIKQYKRKYNL
tara:strand:- start:55 stop:354 length:300 start_codon:yes stop_codon:yes gene_type:complete